MVYKKQRRYKKYYKRQRKRGNWGSRLASVGMGLVSKGGMAYKAFKLARKVADAVNVEYKFIRNATGPNNIDYSGSYQTLNSTSQGVTGITRVGDSLKNQNIIIRGNIARVGQDAIVRVILVWDQQNQLTAVSDFLQAAGANNAPFSVKNEQNRFRFKTLYDRTFNIDTYHPQRQFEIIQSLNRHTEFSDASTTIRTGALHLLWISNVVTTNLPTMQFYSQLSFTDN